MSLLAILVPLTCFVLVYAILSPWLYERNLVLGEVFSKNSPFRGEHGAAHARIASDALPINKQLFRLALLFSFVVPLMVVVGTNFSNSYLATISVFNLVLAGIGMYVLTKKWYCFPLAVPLVLFPPLANLLVLLIVIGSFAVASNALSLKSTKFFLTALIIMDVFLVSSGLLTQIFPFSLGDSSYLVLNSFHFPFGVQVGGGDLFGLMLLANLVIAEKGRRLLVGCVYVVGIVVAMSLVLSGTFSIFPATIPLGPALIVHLRTRKRQTQTLNV